jgi:hypothetical protein
MSKRANKKDKVFTSKGTRVIKQSIQIPTRKPPIIIRASTEQRSRSIISIFNKIFNQGSQLLSTLINKYKGAPPSSQPENININSLVTVFPSCHSYTTTNTYSENYIEFVEEQQQNYNNFIELIGNNLQSNSYFNSKIKTKLRSQLKAQTTNGYDNVSIDNFRNLFGENTSIFISAVSQGTCVVSHYAKGPTKYTSDAQIISNLHALSKNMLQQIHNDKTINSNIIQEYIKSIKQVLRKEDYNRYVNQIYYTYNTNVEEIIHDLKFILNVFKYLELTQTYDMSKYKDYENAIKQISRYFNQLDALIKGPRKDMFEIPTPPKITLIDPTTKQPITIDDDINCLKLLLNIINTLITNPELGQQFNTGAHFDITDYIQRYSIHISDWDNYKIPLYLTNTNDADNSLLILQDILDNVLWQVEPVNPDVNNDISMLFKPSSDETRSDLDCQYGVNIMAAARLCTTGKSKCIDFFRFNPYSINTRSQYSKQKSLETEIKASGTDIFEDKSWRNLGMISFYNNFLDMFLENNVAPQNQNKAKMIIYMYFNEILTNINRHLLTKSNELNLKKAIVQKTQQDIQEIDNDTKYIQDFDFRVKNIEKLISETTLDTSINDFNFQRDELSRIYDFVHILKKILYEEELFMSILKYYFQYLIKFDYAIYELPSCRNLQDPTHTYSKPKRTTTSEYPTQEDYEKGLQKMGKDPKTKKGGMFKTKKRKYCINRKTKKIRKIKRLKKYKLN